MTENNQPHESLYKLVRNASTGPYDAIVVGSGMGGMSCAAALAKKGKRVLVLEQHYIPGGFTHMFSRKGYAWDVGVHAVGEMQANEIPGKMLRWLTNGEIKMNSLGSPYDRFNFPDDFKIEFPDSREKFVAILKEKFPEEAKAIDRYLKLVDKAVVASMAFFAGRSFPEWLDRILSKVVGFFTGNLWKKTTEEVLNTLTKNEKLKAVLTAQWGYYGSTPNESSFAIHAVTVKHFLNGAYYPVGGSKSFADNLLKVVQNAGGETLVRASVKEILVQNGRAKGVKLETGEEFFAPIVISAAGIRATLDKMLPKEEDEKPWIKETKPLGDSPSYICLNMGFKGDIKASGAAPSNFWFMETWDMNKSLWNVEDPDSIPFILYVSFPSLKDPLHDPGPEQMHTGECITFLPWGGFERWKETRRGQREKSYQEYKKAIQERLVARLRVHLPEVMKHLDYYEMSTPLSTQFFTRAHQGAIYGLETTPRRFLNKKLRTRTPIKGFYLSGSDVTTLGIAGAMTGGLLTAATIHKTVYMKMI